MKLTRCISLFLVFLVLIASTGFALNLHFCGGTIASISLKLSEKKEREKKCCAVNEKDIPCCKNTVVHVEKMSDNAIVKTFLFEYIVPFFNSIPFSIELGSVAVPSNELLAYYVDSNAPPLFKLYSQYIFYA